MKTITKNTILKQGDKVYQPVEVHSILCWVDKSLERNPNLTYTDGEIVYKDNLILPSENFEAIVAQSSPILESIPVISLDSYVERLAKENYKKHSVKDDKLSLDEQIQRSGGFIIGHIEGFKSNANKWTKGDLVKAIDLARKYPKDVAGFADEEILEQISSLKEIEVDENFNVINFK
jgi:hypothetical protein